MGPLCVQGARCAQQGPGARSGRQVQAAGLALAAPESYNVVRTAEWLLQGYTVQFGLFSAAALAFGVRSLSSGSESERSGNHLSAMINFIAAMVRALRAIASIIMVATY